MEEEPFDDWPLDGERSIARNARELRRDDQLWLQHHAEWAKNSGVRADDGSMREHKALCTALHRFTCCDQLCVVNLAGCEAINSRRALIEFAHEGRPDQPRWMLVTTSSGTSPARLGPGLARRGWPTLPPSRRSV